VPGYAGSISYHPNGMVHQVAHINNVTYTQANDPNAMRRPASYATSGAAINWTSGTYAYDGAGNVTAIGANTYTYDKVSRLISASQYAGTTAGTGALKTQTAAYDVYGNLTSLTTDGAGLTLGTSTATNRLTTANYDAAGSMTAWNLNTYAYEPLGMTRRVNASGVEYDHVYTADDERHWTFSPGNPSRFTVRDLDGKVLREFKWDNVTWVVERDYVYRDGTLLAAVLPTGAVHHLHPDHLGSPRLITTTGGAYVAYHLYHPYGAEATAFNQDTERMKFTGHERDLGLTSSAADDLDYMHARYYNMQIGKFLAFDPVGGSLRRPQSWNRYSYVLSNPLNLVDLFGLFPCGPWQCHHSVTVIGRHPRWDILTYFLESRLFFGDARQRMALLQNRLNRFGLDGVLARYDQALAGNEWAMWELGMEIPGIESVGGPVEWGILVATGSLAASFSRPTVEPITKQLLWRKALGSDGGRSLHIIERVEGKAISRVHRVFDKNGRLIHQHQTHIGRHGTERAFPSEWVEYPPIDIP